MIVDQDTATWTQLFSACFKISYMTRGNKALWSKLPATGTETGGSVAEVACSVERILREASLNKEHEKVAKIVHQLCHDFAYAVHQPYARNGGLIGLAAAAIALGTVWLCSAETLSEY